MPVTTHLKDDLKPLIKNVLTYDGAVPIRWEHHPIPDPRRGASEAIIRPRDRDGGQRATSTPKRAWG